MGKHSVTLDKNEILQAALVGVIRQVENLGKDRKPYYGAGSDNDWQLHVEGALGEMAFAKFVGEFWSGAHSFRADDVGPWRIRTRSKEFYELIVHKEDPDDKRFVLVTGKNGHYTIHGWIWGSEAKKEEWWKDPAGNRPAYFVPQSALVDIGIGIEIDISF